MRRILIIIGAGVMTACAGPTHYLTLKGAPDLAPGGESFEIYGGVWSRLAHSGCLHPGQTQNIRFRAGQPAYITFSGYSSGIEMRPQTSPAIVTFNDLDRRMLFLSSLKTQQTLYAEQNRHDPPTFTGSLHYGLSARWLGGEWKDGSRLPTTAEKQQIVTENFNRYPELSSLYRAYQSQHFIAPKANHC